METTTVPDAGTDNTASVSHRATSISFVSAPKSNGISQRVSVTMLVVVAARLGWTLIDRGKFHGLYPVMRIL